MLWGRGLQKTPRYCTSDVAKKNSRKHEGRESLLVKESEGEIERLYTTQI
jgi:hypothetical protein